MALSRMVIVKQTLNLTKTQFLCCLGIWSFPRK